MSFRVTQVGLLAAALSACAPVARLPDDSQWNDPSRVFTVTVNSTPPLAAMFGMAGSVAGSRIGNTPITLQYTATGVFPNLFVWCRNCGGVGTPETLVFTKEDMLFSGSCAVVFHIVLTADGYKPYFINQTLYEENGLTLDASGKNCWDDLAGRHMEFTALMEQQTVALQPQQQQQQQQQQMLVIPAQEGQRGTIFVTANVTNAEVFVDSVFVGNVPATLRLADGIHLIEVKGSGYEPYRREIRVMAGAELSLRVALTRQ